jgi:hypothetical protein
MQPRWLGNDPRFEWVWTVVPELDQEIARLGRSTELGKENSKKPESKLKKFLLNYQLLISKSNILLTWKACLLDKALSVRDECKFLAESAD